MLGVTPLGEAAYNAVVPRGSVGTLQLKRNAATSSKIAPNSIRTSQVVNSSLLTEDFKPGQIPQGPKGDKGDRGERGPSWDQWLPGDRLAAAIRPGQHRDEFSSPTARPGRSCSRGLIDDKASGQRRVFFQAQFAGTANEHDLQPNHHEHEHDRSDGVRAGNLRPSGRMTRVDDTLPNATAGARREGGLK